MGMDAAVGMANVQEAAALIRCSILVVSSLKRCDLAALPPRQRIYASVMYCCTMRCVLKNDPWMAMACSSLPGTWRDR